MERFQIDRVYLRRLAYNDDGSVEAWENPSYNNNTVLIFKVDCKEAGKSRDKLYKACHEIELYENVKRESAITYIKHKAFPTK